MATKKPEPKLVAAGTVTVQNQQLHDGDPLPEGVTDKELAFLKARSLVREVVPEK